MQKCIAFVCMFGCLFVDKVGNSGGGNSVLC